ncbi:MAG: thiamine phosphate synthase [Bacteroidetes bacterium]|nr:thiamine phosphate synthase [Bacteroidota bacterium]
MMYKLQYISQGKTANEQTENIQGALDAGCKWVQLRFKNAEKKELLDLAVRIKECCTIYQATFILNDHVDIARMVDADGVHLGLLDTPAEKARGILGENKIIGGTANTLQDVLMRINEKCDYIGLGPFRFTSTKEKLSPVLGLNGIAGIMKELLSGEKLIPVYAIGGIILDDVSEILNAGVYGIAVSGAITNHSNKKELIQKINLLLHEEFDHCR